MDEGGDTKDDVKVPDGDLGERISRLFRDEEKDLSTLYTMRGFSFSLFFFMCVTRSLT